MLRLEFILPFIYGGITSLTVIKMGLFNLGMNFVTWSIYFANLFIAYTLYKTGRVIDRCLGRLFL